MKIIHNVPFLFAMAVAAGMLFSCSEDEELPKNGEPRISYIRIPDPASADSLLVAGYQDNMIVIVGENLQGVREVWFNDRQAELLPTFVTRTTVFTKVPGEIPAVITNKMALVFSAGDTLFHDFRVAISAPRITSMKSEYVMAGQVATIRGDFFYEPVTVTFTGGVEGTVVTPVDDEKNLQVIVPEGAEPGPVTVTTNFGEAVSDFWFLDNRNIIFGFDPWVGWWGEDRVTDGSNPGDPVAINGNYIRYTEKLGAWQWSELTGGPPEATGGNTKNLPAAAIEKPQDFLLKFEINTLKPFNGSAFRINIGTDDAGLSYNWLPPFDTEGEWQTVSLPFDEVIEGQGLVVSPAGYYMRFLFQEAAPLDADIAFDNFRVVPVN